MIELFHYRLAWRGPAMAAGDHGRGDLRGGSDYASTLPFDRYQNPRSVDMRASVQNPYQTLMVRDCRERVSVPVYLLLDVSASMGCGKILEKMLRFAQMCAASAFHAGDRLGILACDSRILWEYCLPLSANAALTDDWGRRFANIRPQARNTDAFIDLASYLGRQRALVFLLSDFYLPDAQLRTLLEALFRHEVVPVQLAVAPDFGLQPRWGWLNLQDPETGLLRQVMMRPALRRRWLDEYAMRQQRLHALLTGYGRRLLPLADDFGTDDVTRYFLS
ncbi:hypothetical protein F6R98_05185 [Candidatus Methylospira mobilis]|uniref:DUF58 domain-containing protein n=1 Tax=Candidatus Methylospira mobilis TaxID=1808979 RepID=A0A5Q0BJW4_9GAMM|nr:hypothetical protein [Candidatus Methylospira mobilis]QFY42096.1 hypothetical protein F6R98_05185 [Candidatus Methylospira mobilis]